MKRAVTLSAVLALFAANVFATYIVVLRNGSTYKAKAKWTVSNGKAVVQLENGQTLQLDPALIDEAKSEQATRAGLGGAVALPTATSAPAGTPREETPSLGSSIRLKKTPAAGGAPGSAVQQDAPGAPASSGVLGPDVIEKFARAYENVGLFEQNLTAVGPATLRAELTADTEDKVFNAISATSFLIMRNAGIPGARIDQVELFMKTNSGGSAGRFQMNRTDAEALDSKRISQQEYFVRRVIF